jgi:hypothetical protein
MSSRQNTTRQNTVTRQNTTALMPRWGWGFTA